MSGVVLLHRQSAPQSCLPTEVYFAQKKVLLNPIPESREFGHLDPGIRERRFPGNSRDSGIGNSRDWSPSRVESQIAEGSLNFAQKLF